MDWMSPLGYLIGLGTVGYALIHGQSAGLIFNPEAILLVYGGTLGATLLTYPTNVISQAIRAIRIFLLPGARPMPSAIITLMLRLSEKVRRQGIDSLEGDIAEIRMPFLANALRMLLDGVSVDLLKGNLIKEIRFARDRHTQVSNVFRSMASYAPIFGLLGTLVGVVQVLMALTDPRTIGTSMAIAMTSTFYGIFGANFLFLPIAQNPKYRYQVGIDLRNENWNLRQGAEGPAPVLGALNLRRYAANAQVISMNSGRWSWLAGAELSHRDYRNVLMGPSLPTSVLLSGFQLKQITQVNYQWARLPERRFESKASITSEAGRIWSAPSHSFEKLQGSVSAHWCPQMSGDDYAVQGQLRAGKTFGSLPFDELFMLGVERDNELWMRGHVGTRDGMKGSAPLGRNYFLANWEIDKRIYHNGFFSFKLSPFLDTGRITDSLPGLGLNRWLIDTGVQAKFRLMGVGITLIYGKDLRTGHNAFYATAQ